MKTSKRKCLIQNGQLKRGKDKEKKKNKGEMMVLLRSMKKRNTSSLLQIPFLEMQLDQEASKGCHVKFAEAKNPKGITKITQSLLMLYGFVLGIIATDTFILETAKPYK